MVGVRKLLEEDGGGEPMKTDVVLEVPSSSPWFLLHSVVGLVFSYTPVVSTVLLKTR